jgi:hypothetical protein
MKLFTIVKRFVKKIIAEEIFIKSDSIYVKINIGRKAKLVVGPSSLFTQLTIFVFICKTD